jgi:hypothetical protein
LRIDERDFLGRLASLAVFARTVVPAAIFIAAGGIEDCEILANCTGCLLCLRPAYGWTPGRGLLAL